MSLLMAQLARPSRASAAPSWLRSQASKVSVHALRLPLQTGARGHAASGRWRNSWCLFCTFFGLGRASPATSALPRARNGCRARRPAARLRWRASRPAGSRWRRLGGVPTSWSS